jgi:hypothetical protein
LRSINNFSGHCLTGRLRHAMAKVAARIRQTSVHVKGFVVFAA